MPPELNVDVAATGGGVGMTTNAEREVASAVALLRQAVEAAAAGMSLVEQLSWSRVLVLAERLTSELNLQGAQR